MEPRPSVQVIGPRGPRHPQGEALLAWARSQLEIAGQIVDNPGGGLLFATQAMGQVKASLQEAGEERWQAVVAELEMAEDAAVKRHYEPCRARLTAALQILG